MEGPCGPDRATMVSDGRWVWLDGYMKYYVLRTVRTKYARQKMVRKSRDELAQDAKQETDRERERARNILDLLVIISCVDAAIVVPSLDGVRVTRKNKE